MLGHGKDLQICLISTVGTKKPSTQHDERSDMAMTHARKRYWLVFLLNLARAMKHG